MPESDPHVLGPGFWPTPFTAAEIREASRGGKTIRLLVEHPDGARTERVNSFSDGDDDGAMLTQWVIGDDAPATERRVTWAELQGHASFPHDRSHRSTETIDHPLGHLECIRFDVRSHPDAAPATFWFALAFPGMPVLYETPVEGGIERTIVTTIE